VAIAVREISSATASGSLTTLPAGDGTGGVAFLAGGAVRGGGVIADWPGLARGALLDNRDLRPTMDLRRVFKAVLEDPLRIDAKTLATRVFPDSAPTRPLPGMIRA
jgi:uncharacterized protein (DUF1501 family)